MTRCCGPSPLAGFVDLCPGDGALALSSYNKGICYTGLCFSDSHNKFLSEHLERSIWHAMSDDSNPLYEPRQVVSLVDDNGGGGGPPGPAGKSSVEAQSKGTSKGETCQQASPLNG